MPTDRNVSVSPPCRTRAVEYLDSDPLAMVDGLSSLTGSCMFVCLFVFSSLRKVNKECYRSFELRKNTLFTVQSFIRCYKLRYVVFVLVIVIS